jgi:hypothetical protein
LSRVRGAVVVSRTAPATARAALGGVFATALLAELRPLRRVVLLVVFALPPCADPPAVVMQHTRCVRPMGVEGVRGVFAGAAGAAATGGEPAATGAGAGSGAAKRRACCVRRGVRERTPQRRLAEGVHGVLGVRGVRVPLRPARTTSPPPPVPQQLVRGVRTKLSASAGARALPPDGLWCGPMQQMHAALLRRRAASPEGLDGMRQHIARDLPMADCEALVVAGVRSGAARTLWELPASRRRGIYKWKRERRRETMCVPLRTWVPAWACGDFV